jgi:hypothetical protein
MSECTVQILSGWVVKLVIRRETLRIPSRDRLHGGGIHGCFRKKILIFIMKALDDEDADFLGVVGNCL